MRAALEAAGTVVTEEPAAPVVDAPTAEPVVTTVEPEVISEQRTDDAPAAPEPVEAVVTAEPAVPEAPKPAKVAAPKDQRNNITRPGKGKCLDVWVTLDSMRAQGVEITFALLRAAIPEDIADATLRTQRQRWKKFHS
jgi:hypothetical protein